LPGGARWQCFGLALALGEAAGMTALPGFGRIAAPWAAPAVGLIAVRSSGQIAMP